MGRQTVNDTRYAPWDDRSRKIHAVAHRIAGADLDRNLVFLHQLHQFHAERDYETVDIRTRDILQMTARADARLQALADNA